MNGNLLTHSLMTAADNIGYPMRFSPARLYGRASVGLKSLVMTLFAVLAFTLTGAAEAAKPAGGGNGGGGSSLTAPSALSASALSQTQIGLTWVDPNSGENGFAIERSLNATSGFAQIASVGKDVSAYTNSSLNSGTTYYYRVRATGRRSTYSAYSNTASATTDAVTTDTQPPSVAINPSTSQTYTSAQTVTVSAAAADNVGVARVDFYDGSTLKKSDTAAPFDFAWTVSGSDNGTHTWKAIARDAAGNTSQSSVNLTVNVAVADTTPPTVSITSPAYGTTFTSAQTVSVSATASDNVGVSGVRFYRDGSLVFTDTSAPYSYGWSISSSDNGAHTLTASAYDAAGNTASLSISVTVNIPTADTTPPTVSITSPASGTTYTSAQTVTISASASDNVGVSGVRFYDNGALVSTDTSAPYAHNWSFTSANNGTHSWTATAYDAAGNLASAIKSLNVNIAVADTTPPTVSITSPASGSDYTSAQTVTVNASASDNIGVTKVEFYDNGVLKATDTGSPYSYAWSFTAANNGSHAWTAKAFDAAGNVRTSSSVSVNVNITTGTSGAHVWSRAISGNRVDKAGGIAVDSNGDVVITGYYANSVNAGGGTLGCADSRNMLVAKYTAGGSHLWSQCVAAGGGSLTANAIAIDGSGNVVVVGDFSGTVAFGSQSLTSVGGTDVFVAKYTTNGFLQWVVRDGGGLNDKGWGITTDGSGNIITTGGLQNPDTIFASKYSSSGALLWTRGFTGQGNNAGQGVATDAQNNVLMTGVFYGTIQLDNSTVSLTSTTSWDPDSMLVKFNASGNLLWARNIGTEGEERSTAIAVDPATGDSVVTGYFAGATDFGQGTVNSAGYDIFLVKYNANGQTVWAKTVTGTGNDYSYGVAVDARTGDVVMTGKFEYSKNFGGQTLTSQGSADVFVARYNSSGAHRWSKSFGSPYLESAKAVAMDPNGQYLNLTGDFTISLDFGGGTITGDAGYGDIFMVQLVP
jgi:hypothetical protein